MAGLRQPPDPSLHCDGKHDEKRDGHANSAPDDTAIHAMLMANAG